MNQLNNTQKRCFWTTRILSRVGVFGAIATLLYIVPFLRFSVPVFASFLEVNFSDIAALIGGFAYGPLVAMGIQIVKVVIKLPFSTTAMVGELADLILGIAFVVPAALFYHRFKTKKGAIMALVIGSISHLVIATLANGLFLTNFYVQFYFGGASEALVSFIQSTNPNVTNLGWSYLLWAIIPFNALRNLLISTLTFLIYKKIHRLIRQIAFLG